MPESNRPLVERIARVLAGAAHSSNAEGSDPSAGEKVDLVWPEHVNQALAVLAHHARARRGDGRGRRRGHLDPHGRGGDRPADRGRRTAAKLGNTRRLICGKWRRRLSGRRQWIAQRDCHWPWRRLHCSASVPHWNSPLSNSPARPNGPDGRPVRRRQERSRCATAGDGRGRRQAQQAGRHSAL